MPASGNQKQRPNQLPPALFWGGVGLAALAALLLLVGDGTASLRVAVFLALVSVVLIGVSAALRGGPAAVRAELEDTIYDEVDQLRDQLRQDIGNAARATHRQFSEKLQALHESVEALRAQVGAGPFELPEGQPAGMGAPRLAAHPHVPPAHAAAAAPAGGHPHPGYVPGGQPQPGRAHAGAAGPPMGGVVRHTETVQVTTRHTYVDPHGDPQGGRGTVYGGTTYGRPAEPAAAHGDWEEPDAGESWTEQRLRERLNAARGVDAPAAEPREGRRSRAHERDEDDPGADERWSGMRAGDRWASVRSDERGRELRVGERRAALHSDESGTELRIEDRWASVRRDESRRWGSEDRWSEDRWGPEVEDTGRWGDRDGQAALPAGGVESGQGQDWESDRGYGSRGRAGRRRARDDDDDGYDWRSELSEPQPVRVRSRRSDYETDDRWR